MPHLFVVEDETTDMELIGRSLKKCPAPIFVHKFKSGKEAIGFLNEQGTPFDAAIIDLNLPDMAGTEVIKALRNHTSGRETSILAVSGASNGTCEEEAFRCGANCFLNKGWDSTAFEAALLSAVNHFLV